jgi:hypothetical protein
MSNIPSRKIPSNYQISSLLLIATVPPIAITAAKLMARDKTNLDIFWLKDKSLADLDNLPDPDILANEIIENIEAGLASFCEIMDTINAITLDAA